MGKLGEELMWNWTRIMAYAIGYCCSLFPFAKMTRQLFFYHYIIPNLFGMFTFVALIDLLLVKFPRFKAGALTYVQVLTALAFFFWSVWTYGIEMQDFDIRLWNSKWQ
jgi:dolichyl-phosphate-mannose--protein O-mannosyl transferase